MQVANGLSIANTFTGSLPGTIETAGAPFAVSGLQVAVVDPTALAVADDIFFDLTNSVTGSVQSRLDGVRQGTAAGQAVAQVDGDDGLSFTSSIGSGRDLEAWVSAFGLAREQRATSPAVGADHYLAGLVAGLDGQVAPDTRGGFSWAARMVNWTSNSGLRTRISIACSPDFTRDMRPALGGCPGRC